MATLADAAAMDALLARLGKLHPQRPRAWGKMTPHEMICHLADSFRAGLGERETASVETWFQRTVVKYIALRSSMTWPKGIQTRPENDQTVGGTKPVEFERDRADLIALIHRFAAADARYGRHPMWGTMTRDEWLIWGYRHLDHHLRQFAL